MLELQPLVFLLQLAQLFELRQHLFVHFNTFGHDQSLSRLFAPTRQHERVDVKRPRDITHFNARKPAEANGCRLEVIAVLVRRLGPGLGIIDTPDR